MVMQNTTGNQMTAKTHPPTPPRKKPPRVGVFWLVGGKLVIDSMPLSDGEPYGDHLTHPRSHIDVWDQWRLGGKVPSESEYEKFPRGRVMYNTKTQRFTLLADRCILRDKDVVSRIASELHLPSENMDRGNDEHYRCSSCLKNLTKD
jgi:hypothetical protein